MGAWAEQFPQMPKYDWLSNRELAQLEDLENQGELSLRSAQTVLGTNQATSKADAKSSAKTEVTEDGVKVTELPYVDPSKSASADVETEDGAEFRRNFLDYYHRMEDPQAQDIFRDWVGFDLDANGEMVMRDEEKSYAQIGAGLVDRKTGKLGITKQAVGKQVRTALKDLGFNTKVDDEADVKKVSPKALRQGIIMALAGTDLETINRNLDLATTESDDTGEPVDLDKGGAEGTTLDGEARAAELESGTNDDVGAAEDSYETDLDAARQQEAGILMDYLADDVASGRVLESDIHGARHVVDVMMGKGDGAFASQPVSKQAESVRLFARARVNGDPTVKKVEATLNAKNQTGAGTGATASDPETVRRGEGAAQGVQPSSAGVDAQAGSAVREVPQAGNQTQAAAVVVKKKKRRVAAPAAETEERPATPFTQEATTEPTDSSFGSTTQIERNLRAKSHDKENPGDVMLNTTGKFVSLEDAVAAAREAMTPAQWKMPFQFNRMLDIAGRDWDRMVKAMADEPTAPFSKPQFSKGDKATKGSDAKALAAELRAFMRVGTLGDRVVVVQSIKDIPAGVQRSVSASQNTQGFVFGGKAYLIADQIAAGDARAVFLHEVGAHLGMEEILGAHYDTLVGKVMEWAKRVDNSQEFKLADKAIQRALDAAGNGELNDTELVAYFIEEAINAGIEPSALKHGPLRQFMQQIFDLFKKAIARFYGNPDKVTAQDFVDLAYGAARIEMKEPINPGGGDGAPKFSIAKKAEDQARKVAGETGAKIAVDTTNLASKALGALSYLHDIVESAKAKLPSAEKWYKATMDIQAARNRMNQEAERIVKMFTETGIRADKVNKMLFDATFEQKWPYDTQRLDRKTGQMVTIKADPELANRFDNELTAKERAIVKAVFAHGEKTLDHKYAVLKKLGLTGTFKAETGKLQGPYAPLKRFGNYISVLKSADLVAAEDAGDEKLVEKLKADPQHYEVRFHDTKGQASEYARANAKAGGQAYHFEKSERVGGALPMNSRVLSNIRAALKMDDKMPPQARAHFEQMLQELEFQALDEHHARTSGLTRKNRAGAEEDMMRSFLANARAQSNFLAQLEYGKEANTQFYAMQREASKDGYAGQDEFNLLAKHYAASFDTRDTPIQNRITATTTALQLATSLGYHITNALQGVMVTVPKLAADFNDYTGAMDQLHNGYKTWLAAGGLKGKFDLDGVKDAGLRAALQHAAVMGVLDVGMTEDLSQFEAFRTGYKGIDAASGKMSKLMHKLNQVSRYVETANRVSAATAAYNMAMAKHGDQAKAQEYAARILQTTQGDFSATGSPLIFKRLPKFVMQYKKYQFMMASLYANAFKAALHGATPEERAVGRRFLAYKLATTGVAAGFLGMPLMNVAALVFGMTGDDDEPRDLERSLRDWIGDDGMADVILRGPLNAIGLDMSAKLGDDKIFSIAPYTDIDFSSGASAAKTLVGIGGGPAASQLMRMATGVEYLSKGDMQKGFENLVPSGLANASKALRIANEGFTLKNGTVMYSPDEISGLTMMFDAIGLKSSQMKHMEWVRGQQYEIGQFVSDRTKELKADYVQAYRDGNTDELGKLSEHWLRLQEVKRDLRPMFNNSVDELKTQPLSDLLRSPANALKRDLKAQKASW